MFIASFWKNRVDSLKPISSFNPIPSIWCVSLKPKQLSLGPNLGFWQPNKNHSNERLPTRQPAPPIYIPYTIRPPPGTGTTAGPAGTFNCNWNFKAIKYSPKPVGIRKWFRTWMQWGFFLATRGNYPWQLPGVYFKGIILKYRQHDLLLIPSKFMGGRGPTHPTK